MAGEHPVHIAHFVHDEDSEREAYHPRGNLQGTVEARESLLRVFEGQRDCGGDDHHACNGANAENEKVGDGPIGIADGRKYEQCDRGGAGEAVHEAYEEWPHGLIQAELPEDAIHPAYWSCRFRVAVFFGFVRVRVGVDVIAMHMGTDVRVSA
jgi:hypothetical protein